MGQSIPMFSSHSYILSCGKRNAENDEATEMVVYASIAH